MSKCRGFEHPERALSQRRVCVCFLHVGEFSRNSFLKMLSGMDEDELAHTRDNEAISTLIKMA